MDPVAGQLMNYLAPTQLPVLNTIVRGATSGAIGRVVDAANAGTIGVSGSVILQTLGPWAFQANETVNFDSGGSATVSVILDPTTVGGINQYVPQRFDAITNSFVPNDGVSDQPWYDRRAKIAQQITLASGYTGAFAVGDRITTSGGGAFTVLTSAAGGGGTLLLRIVRKSGSIAAAQTVTNTTQAGAGTISVVDADPSTGTWIPFHLMPNINGTGVGFEQIPLGNGTPAIGPEAYLLRQAYEKHLASASANDRGVRMLQFVSLDRQPTNGLLGGVTVQVVVCTGTFASNWTLGETVNGGSWSAKLVGFNVSAKKLYVTNTNDQTLGAVVVTGATSGATATSTGAAYGWQKGSAYWNDLVAEKADALARPNALYAGSAARHEGIFLMIWETELAPFSVNGAPWSAAADQLQSWSKFILDLRTEFGRADLPITLFHNDVRSQSATIQVGGVPFAYVMRELQSNLARTIDNVTLTTTTGMQPAQSTGLPYTSNLLFLRTEDYFELGLRAWRALEFASFTPPNANFEPLPLIFIGGQSQAVVGTSFTLSSIDRDPDFFSSVAFPGVSTIDPAVKMWNASDNVLAWESFDCALNGNTFFQQGGFSPLMAALASRMKRRFSTGDGSAEVGFIHLPVGGTTVNASAPGALITWDPLGTSATILSSAMTMAPLAATAQDPALGRLTATAGFFSAVSVGSPVQISGSAGLIGAGGNNHSTYNLSIVYRKAADSSWIDLNLSQLAPYAYVSETATLTVRVGPIGLWPFIESQVRSAFEKCVTQLRRVPKPVLVVWWQGESDLVAAAQYQAATQRVLDGIHAIFGQKHKGETKTATVILKLTRRTPWGTDQDVETIIAAQEAVAAALGNAAVVDTDKLPMEISSPPVFPRTVRQHNGVHHTAYGARMAGFLADAAAGQLVGIPDHPDGAAAADFGAVGGAILDDGADNEDSTTEESVTVFDGKPTEDSGEESAGTDASEAEATSLLDQVEAAWGEGSTEIQSYVLNGQPVVLQSLDQQIRFHQYLTTLKQRASGIRQTRVAF